jgi:hypothetical protein
MLKKHLIILTVLLSLNTYTQNNKSTIQHIETTIQNYYDGYIYRDINKLNLAFDIDNGTMKIPQKENNTITGYKNTFFKDLMPKWGNRKQLSKKVLKNCVLEILNIDVVDEKIASAKISMKLDTVTYIDILSLEKIKDYWKITNKIYIVRK